MTCFEKTPSTSYDDYTKDVDPYSTSDDSSCLDNGEETVDDDRSPELALTQRLEEPARQGPVDRILDLATSVKEFWNGRALSSRTSSFDQSQLIPPSDPTPSDSVTTDLSN